MSDAHPYSTPLYAETLRDVGRPRFVKEWDTSVIVRDTGQTHADAMGTYPLAMLSPQADLGGGLAALRQSGLVSATLVIDGLHGPSLTEFTRWFPVFRPFKTHYLVDPAAGPYQPSKHHADRVRRAARRGVVVARVSLAEILDEWCALYAELVRRHDISGVQRFSRDAFARLAQCPGLATFAAYLDNVIVSVHVFVVHGTYALAHLAASSAAGYANSAAFAIYDAAIRAFAGNLINLGGAAGVVNDGSDGLAMLKAGFANRTHSSFLAGAILDEARYERLSAGTEAPARMYFPAYRAPRHTERTT